LIAFTSV